MLICLDAIFWYYKLKHIRKYIEPAFKSIEPFLTEKSYSKVYIILIHWIELAFFLYENQTENKKTEKLIEWN